MRTLDTLGSFTSRSQTEIYVQQAAEWGDGERETREGGSEGAARSVGLTNSVEAAPPSLSAHASVAPVDHGGTASSHGNCTLVSR